MHFQLGVKMGGLFDNKDFKLKHKLKKDMVKSGISKSRINIGYFGAVIIAKKKKDGD